MSDETETEGGEGGENTLLENMPTYEQLDRVLKDLSLQTAEKDSAVGKIRETYKDSGDRFNFHRKALQQVASLERMDDTKRTEYLVHLLHYIGLRGLGPHPDLFEDERTQELANMASKDEALLAEAEAATKQ
ncbi:MAG: hypothetical protein AAGH90_11000 [Pseudomonadota bacterium]